MWSADHSEPAGRACGSAAPSDGADPGPTTATEADPVAPETAAPETTGEAQDAAPQDVASIDWATVDLSTIDWENIDVSRIDAQALQENPTVPELDAETNALIQEGMSSGNATLLIGDQAWEGDRRVGRSGLVVFVLAGLVVMLLGPASAQEGYPARWSS